MTSLYIYIPKVHKNILNNNNLGKANPELLKGKVIGHFDHAHQNIFVLRTILIAVFTHS